MRTPLAGLVTLALTVVLLGLVATAHPHDYPTQHPPYQVVSFDPGHVAPASDGSATFSVTDAVTTPMGGIICQDVAGNGFCGDPGELGTLFCGVVTVFDTAHGGLWQPGTTTWIWPDGVFFYAHGCGLASFATTGSATHS